MEERNRRKRTGFNANPEKLLQIYVEDADLTKLKQFTNVMTEDFKPIIGKQLSHLENFSSFTKRNSVYMIRAFLRRSSEILPALDVNVMNYLSG